MRFAYSHADCLTFARIINELSRRRFLSQAGTGVGAAWISANWPEMVAAATHAQRRRNRVRRKLEFFTPAEATEIDALSARIIPTDDTPGAREAGVVYFIDRALMTFGRGDQQIYRDGLVQLQRQFTRCFLVSISFRLRSRSRMNSCIARTIRLKKLRDEQD